ncbi:hypothetical protein IV203_007741 [Nitzschia inconspicua]|uniref:Uncharacterized protein n=1 Tax=Nitzschia inconspicua TaxID=303405 RepID=A0A9K3KYU6_9STRA|nr:hypothetical protein IV203_007741 [Nitzschia inconspicua]
MDSFAQKTADLPLQRKEDVPSLRKAHQDVMQMSFLPEEIKTRFVAASISDSVGSPQAKELKSFVDNTKMFVPRQDEQYSLIGAAVSYYWNQKTPENRMVAADARPENTQNTPTSDRADGLLYTQSNDEYCKAGDGDTSQKRRKSTHGARETCHSNVAEALDHLGPAIVSVRTRVSSGTRVSFGSTAGIPPSWYIRQYKCYDKACQCDMLVWSPNRDLSSGPAYVLIDDYSKHEDHDPIDWMAWYSYKEGTRRCGGQWDSDKYPKKPGLPFSVLMAVDDVMRVSPNIGPSQAATMVSNRFNYHPLFMNVGPTVDILRKQIMSLMDGRSGNGLYAAKLKTQKPQWLTDEAEPAVKRLARCKTVKQKEKMWHLTKEQWEIDGEGAMAATFAKTYIDNPDFANWHYTASGKHGCVPCNNPMERHNLAIKGSANFFGYIETGKTLFQCLTKEFVVLVYQASTDLSYPSSGLPVVNYEKAFKNDQFMEFQSLLDPNVDIKEYGGGWLVNELTYLALPITEEDVEKMEMALEGKVEENTCMENENKDIRDVLLSRTARFHHVRKSVWTGTNPPIEYFHCDCREYYFKRWCFQSAYMQHREKLSLLGNKIPAKKKCNSKSASSHMAVTNALRAAKERIRVKKRNKTDQPETI